MLKLKKYLKPFLVSIAALIVLLFGQAMCELTMPDYMSKIINVGINSGGIEDGVFVALRESEYQKLALFMDEKQQKLFEENYRLITADNAAEEEKQAYPQVEKEAVYLLKDVGEDRKQQLKLALSDAETTLTAILQAAVPMEMQTDGSAVENLSDEQKQIMEQMSAMMKQLPEGADIFDALKLLPKQQLSFIKKEMTKLSDAMGESTADTANAQLVKKEYEALGMDVDAIQYSYLFKNGGIMLLLALGSAAAAVTVGFLASRVAAGFARNVRRQIFQRVEQFSLAEFTTFSTNTLITRTTNDVQQVQMVTVMILRMVIYAPIIGIGALIKVMNSNAEMTWIIALVIAVIILIMICAFLLVLPKFKISQKLLDKLNGVVREILEGMPVIRAFNNQKVEEEKFEQANRNIMKNMLFTGRAMAMLLPIIMLVMNCSSILIVWVGAHHIDSGSLMVGDMLAFMQYAMQIIMSFMMITMMSILIPRASVAAGRIHEVLETEPSITDPKEVLVFDESKKGNVEFRNVSFRYPGAEEDVLRHLSFTAEAGKTTAFIGSTGSGKSTIVNLVPRFFDVSEGEILVDGVDVRKVSQHALRERIGYVPQKGFLFSGTIASNLRYANEEAKEADLRKASEIAQAIEFIEEKPEGFEAAITQGGTNVSGGQRQRLSIARALVKKPEIFIFDDTFSALDFKTDARLRKALGKLCEEYGSTVLLVAQRISSIMHADRIIVLDKGEIVGNGTHKELMASCEVYQEIAYSQLSKEELAYE